MFNLFNFRYAINILRRSPGFATVAILILGLGIGANTAIFTLVDTVLLRPLPYHDPARLVMLWQSLPAQGLAQVPVSQADFADFQKQSRSFERMAAIYIDKDEFGLTGAGDPEQVRGMPVSANLFSILGAQPMLGRDFLANEDQAGNDNKVMLSYGLWQRRFGGDLAVIGKVITLDRQPRIVVGVMPRGFNFPPAMHFGVGDVPAGKELWVPCVVDKTNRDYHPLGVVARLKQGVNVQQASAEANTLARAAAKAYPKSNDGVGANVSAMQEQVVSNVRPALAVLFSAVGCVLLIACVNVANLLLARSAGRRKELAVRAALGASRVDLIKQMLIENFALAIPGGILGVLLALWSTDLLRSLTKTNLPRLDELSANPAVLAFAAGLCLATGLAAGLLPAFSASRVDLNESLKVASRTLAGARHHTMRNVLVIGQISLALLLLTGAGLLIRSFQQLLHVDPGFQSNNLLSMELRLPQSRYDTPAKLAAFETQLLERIRELSGVVTVGAVNSLPIAGFQGASIISIEGRPSSKSLAAGMLVGQRVASPDYFRTMHTPFLAGRDFTTRDTQGATPAAIINQALAARYFPGEDPLGKRIKIDEAGEEWQTIVGITASMHHSGLSADADPEIFSPYLQGPWNTMAFVVRTRGNPEDLAAAVRSQLWVIDKEQPISRMSTMDHLLSDSLAGRRLNLILLGSFAGVALLLALIGIYGVISYAVVQRTSEIAIRMALGAQRSSVWKLVLAQGASLSAAGIVIGIIASLALTRVMSTMLFHVRSMDPLTIASVAAVVLATALLATFLPARRATRIDPMEALRD
ncbi:MAG TPA: ABC transporter permease [Bryobacteraceae bacterium]|nr:ABC transporter permease [Bryobacteraceae bacterium]